MAEEITTQNEIEQMEALEEEAQEAPDISVYTRKLNKPFILFLNKKLQKSKDGR